MMKGATLHIEGMHCAGCAETVRALLVAEGVEAAEVSLETGQAQIRFDADVVSIEQLETAVARAGYRVKAQRP